MFNVIDHVNRLQSWFPHLSSGCRLISAYNSLTDKHLAGYFSNTRIRRHLQRAGLVPETFTLSIHLDLQGAAGMALV